jgi:hypothetical protein
VVNGEWWMVNGEWSRRAGASKPKRAEEAGAGGHASASLCCSGCRADGGVYGGGNNTCPPTTHARSPTAMPAHAHTHAHAARCEGDREPWPVARRAIRRGEGPRDEKDSPSGGACNRGPTPPLVLVLLTLVVGALVGALPLLVPCCHGSSRPFTGHARRLTTESFPVEALRLFGGLPVCLACLSGRASGL